MTFISLGSVTINLDLVCMVRDLDLDGSAQMGRPAPMQVFFRGGIEPLLVDRAAAAALRSWIASNAQSLV